MWCCASVQQIDVVVLLPTDRIAYNTDSIKLALRRRVHAKFRLQRPLKFAKSVW